MGKAAQLTPAFLGALAELEHHVEHAVPAEASLGALGPVPDRGEGAFDGVRCPDALPVLGLEIVEGQQFVAVFDQAFGGLRVPFSTNPSARQSSRLDAQNQQC